MSAEDNKMNQTQTAFSFSALYGTTKTRPWAEGDILVKHDSRRFVVTHVSENINGQVAVCIALDNGRECVILEKEVAYRTK